MSNTIVTYTNQGSREYMEDRIDYCQPLVGDYEYYAIFDGHGGSDVVNFVHRNMRGIVKTLLINKTSINMTEEEVLYRSFQLVVELLPAVTSRIQGTTAVVALKQGTNIWIANCGDSRAIAVLSNNALSSNHVQLTYDHKPNREDEYQRIIKSGGFVAPCFKGDVDRVNGSLAVSRSIGDLDLSPHVTWKPEITCSRVASSFSYLFFATDGVWDVVNNTEISKILSTHKNTHLDVLEYIATLARSRGSTDNIAILLVDL
jgi:serine/threonine protein phosphatase PrpC